MAKELTLKEAIDQGYKYYGIEGWEFQSCQDLDENLFNEVDDCNHDNIRLFENKPKVITVEESVISDLLAEYISDKSSEECYIVDDTIHDAVKSVDFSEITKVINKKLEEHKYYMLTDIKIIKNDKKNPNRNK